MLGARRRAAVVALLPPAINAALNARHAHVAEQYAPIRRHPSLFEPSQVSTWLDERFLQLIDATERGDDVTPMVTEVTSEVYSFPMLNEAACRTLIEEVAHFGDSGLSARRPNSMNNYGVVLNDVGLQPALSALQALVQPVARALFPVEGESLDDHHTFVVSYRPHQDKGLDMHTDDSDVTLNVCLGDEFTASGLTFCGTMGTASHRQLSTRYHHARGQAVLHLGRRRHGADDIQSGHRINLVMWSYNRAYRASADYRRRGYAYVKEGAPPSPECTSFTHDRDYVQVRGADDPAVRRRAAKFTRTAWCPPPSLEYDGFEGGPGRYGDTDPFHRDLMD